MTQELQEKILIKMLGMEQELRDFSGMPGVKLRLIVTAKTDNRYDNGIAFLLSQFELPWQMVISNSRKRHIVEARKVICYCMRTVFPELSLKEIGRMMGNIDHTSVLHHCRAVQGYMDVYPEWRNKMNKMVEQMKKAVRR